MNLAEYIKKEHSGNQAAFARIQGVSPQQVTKWLNLDCVVVDGKLYSFRRVLGCEISECAVFSSDSRIMTANDGKVYCEVSKQVKESK